MDPMMGTPLLRKELWTGIARAFYSSSRLTTDDPVYLFIEEPSGDERLSRRLTWLNINCDPATYNGNGVSEVFRPNT